MGLPVVATDVPGTRDLVLNTKTGYLVSVDDTGEIVFKIIQLLNNRVKSQAFGRKGHVRVKENYRIEAQIERLERLYLHIYAKEIGERPEAL